MCPPSFSAQVGSLTFGGTWQRSRFVFRFHKEEAPPPLEARTRVGDVTTSLFGCVSTGGGVRRCQQMDALTALTADSSSERRHLSLAVGGGPHYVTQQTRWPTLGGHLHQDAVIQRGGGSALVGPQEPPSGCGVEY